MFGWKKISGVLTLILTLSFGVYWLVPTGSYDICTKDGVRDSWQRTAWGADGYYRHYCAPEDKVLWCEKLADWGGTPNARCYTMEEVWHESPESKTEELTKYDSMGFEGTEEEDCVFKSNYNLRNLKEKVINDFSIEWGEELGTLKNKRIIVTYQKEGENCYENSTYAWNETNNSMSFSGFETVCENISYEVEERLTEEDVNHLLSYLKSSDVLNVRLEGVFDYASCEIVERNDFYNVVHCKADPVISFLNNSYPEWDVWESYKSHWDGDFLNVEEDANGNITLSSGEVEGHLSSNGWSGTASTDCSSFGCVWDELDWAGDDVSKKIVGQSTISESHGITISTFGTYTGHSGMRIAIGNEPIVLKNIEKEACAGGDGAYVLDSLKSEISGPHNFTGDNASLGSGYTLNADTEYYVTVKANGGTGGKASCTFNITETDFIWSHGLGQGTDDYSQCHCVKAIEYEVEIGDSYAGIDICFSNDNSTFSACQTNVTSGTDLGNDTAKYVNWSANIWRADSSITSAKIEGVNITYFIPTLIVKQYAEVESVSSTNIVYNLTIFLYNNGSRSLSLTLNPDDGFSTETYSITLSADEENTTHFTNTTTRGSSDTIFFIEEPHLTGDVTQDGNRLYVIAPAQVTAEAVEADKADIKWLDPDDSQFWEVITK